MFEHILYLYPSCVNISLGECLMEDLNVPKEQHPNTAVSSIVPVGLSCLVFEKWR